MEIVSAKYVCNTLGVCKTKALKMIKSARQNLNKQPHHVLTTDEFLKYYNVHK